MAFFRNLHSLSGLSGATGFVRGMRAGNLDEAYAANRKRWVTDPQAKRQEARQAEQKDFDQVMRNNPDIAETDYDAFRSGFNIRNDLSEVGGEFVDSVGVTFADLGATAGYGAKKALTGKAAKVGGVAAAGGAGVAGAVAAAPAAIAAAPAIGIAAMGAASARASYQFFRAGWDERRPMREAYKQQRERKGRWASVDKSQRQVDPANDPYGFEQQAIDSVNRKEWLKENARPGELKKEALALYNLANSRTATVGGLAAMGVVGVGAGGESTLELAYQDGANRYDYNERMTQIAGNMSVSNNGGGAFIRNVGAPQVDNMGATGDLVFALHSLRNGG